MLSIKLLFKRAFDYKGVSCRKEYWFAILGIFICFTVWSLVMGGVDMILSALIAERTVKIIHDVFNVCFVIVFFIPSISLTVRRLHDANLSGWFYLLSLVPIARIVVFVFMFFDTKVENNKWREYDIQRGYWVKYIERS